MATTACDQYKVILPAMVSGGNGGPYTYNWSNGGTAANNTVVANFNATPQVYTLTISDGCTVPDAKAVYTLDAKPSPQFSFAPAMAKGCAPLDVVFQAASTTTAYNSSTDTYVWDFGVAINDKDNNGIGATQLVNYPTAGTYSFHLLVTNSFGCKKDTTTGNIIEVYPVPHAEFTPNPQTVTILEPTVYFTNFSQGGSTYVWDFGDYASLQNASSAMNPHHDYSVAGNYDVYMVVINSYGCKDTAIHRIVVEPDFSLYIPNAFTPDQNSRNDVFQPKGVGIDEDKYKMEIFDRWGELIFTSNQFSKGWDGSVKGSSQIAQDGVYIYKIYVTDLKGNKKQYVGHVTLLKQ
jgi:gliding motility-associated-like protein